MRFKEIANRLTGITCPIFGITWNPAEPDVTVARRIITYFEDRRVLYNPCSMEDPHHCVYSIIEMRKFLTNELAKSDISKETSESLRAIRAACRKFLDRVQPKDREIIPHANYPGHFAQWVFMDAIGQLRGVAGLHLAQLAVKHGLDVEDELAEIFPEADEEQVNND